MKMKHAKDLYSLEGKVAIVTGGRGLYGGSISTGLCEMGATVVIASRNGAACDAYAQGLRDQGYNAIGLSLDLSSDDSIKALVKEVIDRYGKIDILVNNAGVAGASPAEATPDEEWNYVVGVNLNSVYFVAREVGNVMLKNGYGKIINIGSLHSEVVMPNTCWPVGAYAASKGGVKMLTKALAVEWAKKGITVNTIGPAYFSSEMTGAILDTGAFDGVAATYCPMARAGRPGELDGALIYFASDASSYTTGQYLAVDGGWTAV